jgi:hypothetical protein
LIAARFSAECLLGIWSNNPLIAKVIGFIRSLMVETNVHQRLPIGECFFHNSLINRFIWF